MLSAILTRRPLIRFAAWPPASCTLPIPSYDIRAGFYASEANAPSKEDAKACLIRALELGITFYNTSNLYGPYVNEELIGEHLVVHPLSGITV